MYMSSFGVTHGRQISGFPKYKNWKSTLKQNLDCGPRTKKRINAYLRKKKETLINAETRYPLSMQALGNHCDPSAKAKYIGCIDAKYLPRGF